MRIPIWVFLAPWALLSASAWGQAENPARIASVEFNGLKRVTSGYCQDITGLRAGGVFDKAAADEAATRLLRTGRFQAASYKTEETPDGIRIIFELTERPTISAIKFAGNSKFRDGQLQEVLTQKIDQPADWFAVRDGRDAIVAKYKEAGFGDVQVSFDQAAVERTGELLYTIVEGQKVVIRTIRFEGNANIEERALKKELETKTAWWIFRTGAFDQDVVENDVARIQNYYRDRGYLDARANYVTELSADGQDLTVVFTVEEGTRYSLASVEFHGQANLPEEELSGLIRSVVGEPVDRPKIDADAKAIQERYGSLGFIDARVRPVRVFSQTPGLVRLTFEIEEGEQFRVGKVVVRGNTRTKDKVVRRALNLYPPDDLFDLTEAKEAERRLVETRIFSSARVIPVGDQPGVRDAVLDVVESEKAGDFLFGVGVTSNSGLVGSVVLDMQNFDLFDTPRTWAEFFKLRSFFGGGQRLRIELQPGSTVNRFRIDFTEPYLFDKPLRYDASLFYFQRDRDGYSERRVGQSSSLGKRFEKGVLQGWSGELAFRTEHVTVDDVDLFASNEIRDDRGGNMLSGTKVSLVRDRTDSRFVPSRGDRFRVSYEQMGLLGGDHHFGKLTSSYNWYTTLRTDRQDRKYTLQLRGEGGVMVGQAPVFERFYAGGIGSIRGFEYRGVGERDGIDRNNIGGEYMLLLGGEYSYPLYEDNLRGHVFLDTGTAGSGAYRAAIGTGVRFTLNFLGPLPLEFNLALPIASGSEDDEQVFSFAIGGFY